MASWESLQKVFVEPADVYLIQVSTKTYRDWLPDTSVSLRPIRGLQHPFRCLHRLLIPTNVPVAFVAPSIRCWAVLRCPQDFQEV